LKNSPSKRLFFQDKKEHKRYNLTMIVPFQPNTEEAGPLDWLQQEQIRLIDRLGEPPFITIRLIYDGFYEVEVSTFTDRYGFAHGWSLPEVLASAADCLLALDEFHLVKQCQAEEESPPEIDQAEEETEFELIF
jgi:hypothetical protein